MRTVWLRLLEFFDRERRERRLADEIQSHLDLLTEEHMARGLSREDAALAARRVLAASIRSRNAIAISAGCRSSRC